MNFWERDENTYKNYSGKPRETTDATRQGTRRDTCENMNVQTQTASADGEYWQQKIGEYAGKSQSELMQELMTTATRMKQGGELSGADLDNFYSRVKGFLTDEQKERMQALIEMLKR